MADKSEAPELLRIGDFTLDVARAELTGPRGKVPLRPQSFQVLLLLAHNAGRVVTKEELHSTIWADRAVTDDSLTQCLIDIRRAIGDRKREIIRTVPRRGYIIVGDVPSQTAVAAMASRKYRLVAVAATGLLIVTLTSLWLDHRSQDGPAILDNSVAVLPFVDLGAHADDQYLGDGLAEDILISLGQYKDLRVIARTSTFAQWARAADIAQIRQTLKVEYILEGSLRRTNQSWIIATNLIESSNGTQVWSESYDIGQQELFMIQRSIAAAVADKIAPGVQSTARKVDPESLSDSDLIWLARRYENEVREQREVDRTKLDFAIELYRDAIQANPQSALAHSRLAGALMYGGDIEGAEEHIQEALFLDPDISEVQESLGRYYWARNLPKAAADAWQRAITLNPSNVDALSAYASWLFVSAEVERPKELYRRAVELDPLNLSRYADLGFLVGSQSNIDETERIIREVRELFDSADAYLLIAELSDFAGRIDESIAWTIRARNLQPDNRLLIEALAELYVDIGDSETALKLQPDPGPGVLLKMRRYDTFMRESEMLVSDVPHDTHLRYLLAYTYNVTGRSQDALRVLEELGILREPMGQLRQIIDIEARLILAEAFRATAETSQSREIAEWWITTEHMGGRDWWVHFYLACAFSIVDRNEEALQSIERIPDSPRLPWMYLIEDSPCIKRYADEPRYQAVLQALNERQAGLRQRLPETLAAFDVTLTIP